MNAAAILIIAAAAAVLAPKEFYTNLGLAPAPVASASVPSMPRKVAQAPPKPSITAGPAISSNSVKSKRMPEFKPEVLLQGQNFIHGVPGVVSGSLRNANLQIRSDPPIERQPVSIFNQSTISKDVLRPNVQIGRGTTVSQAPVPERI